MADRIVLTITSELFDDDPSQEASIRTNVSIRSLIAETIKEFNLPEGSYLLHPRGDETPLPMDETLEQLGLQTGAELLFERARNRLSQMLIRRGGSVFHTIMSTQRATLHEKATDTIYDVKWQPALIGRPDSGVPASADRLAVNLGDHPEGRTISRQHARVTESQGNYFIEGLAERNPTFLNDDELVFGEKRGLKSGDVIRVGKVDLEFELHKPGA